MKKRILNIFINLLSLSIGVFYILSTMGYGIHECLADGTKDVIVLFGESPCEYSHSHKLADGRIIVHSHLDIYKISEQKNCSCNCGIKSHNSHLQKVHSSDCCHTTVYSASSDQQVKYFNYSFISPVVTMLLVSNGFNVYIETTNQFIPQIINKGPSLKGRQLITEISQFII